MIYVIDTSNNLIIASEETPDYPFGMAISPDGSRIYTASWYDGTVSVIDALSFSLVTTIDVPYSAFDVAVSPGGEYIYVPTDYALCVIEAASNSIVARISLSGRFLGAGTSCVHCGT